MARRPLIHACFHSVASLGYVPIALTSAFVSSSTPYISIPPIATILIALVPPMISFPVLCISYRCLERFPYISLTVQRARTYVMLAGSGLCFLIAAHLLMIHMLGNAHNSTYNKIHHIPIYHHSTISNNEAPISVILPKEGPGDLSDKLSQSITVLDKITVPTLAAVVPDNFKSSIQPSDSWQPNFISSVVDGNQQKQSDDKSMSSLKFGIVAPAIIKRENLDASLNTQGTAPLEKSSQPEQERDVRKQQQAFVVDNSIPSSGTSSSNTIPRLITSKNSLISPALTSKEKFVDGKNMNIADLDATSHSSAIPNMPQSIPEFNSRPISEKGAPDGSSKDLPPVKLNDLNSTSGNEHGSRAKALFQPVGYGTPGYNLVGLHWIIYIATQVILDFLLIILFLGVLILTEYALDLEDDDVANLTYHYWARFVGVAITTIVSAVNGSILSGYVLLDGESDWIAKAAVVATCIYCTLMTWVTKRIAGPLPY